MKLISNEISLLVKSYKYCEASERVSEGICSSASGSKSQKRSLYSVGSVASGLQKDC